MKRRNRVVKTNQILVQIPVQLPVQGLALDLVPVPVQAPVQVRTRVTMNRKIKKATKKKKNPQLSLKRKKTKIRCNLTLRPCLCSKEEFRKLIKMIENVVISVVEVDKKK